MEVLSQIESLTWAWPFLWEPQLTFVPSSPPGPPSLSACPCLALYLCLCLSFCLSLDRFFLNFIPLNGPSFCLRLLSTGIIWGHSFPPGWIPCFAMESILLRGVTCFLPFLCHQSAEIQQVLRLCCPGPLADGHSPPGNPSLLRNCFRRKQILGYKPAKPTVHCWVRPPVPHRGQRFFMGSVAIVSGIVWPSEKLEPGKGTYGLGNAQSSQGWGGRPMSPPSSSVSCQ